MAAQLREVQETIAMSSEPSDPFTNLPRSEWRDTFFALHEDVREALVRDMSRSQLEQFIDRLDPDEIADVLGYVDEETRDGLLATLDSQRREKIDFLLSFNPESAAGLMNLDYVTVDEDRSFSEIAERVRRFEDRTIVVVRTFYSGGVAVCNGPSRRDLRRRTSRRPRQC
jgi:magnesium transporter